MEKVTKYVLDHGVVTLIDVFGSDERILEAARVSYRKGTKQTSTDEQLLRYLLRKHHASPFEMCEVIFYLKLPIFVARQLVRHRTASLNEVSGRYSELPNEMYLPTTSELGPQSTNNKQGRGEVLTTEDGTNAFLAQGDIDDTNAGAYKAYEKFLKMGISKEISRIVLPVATYTEMYWKMDLRNFMGFLKLRLDPHAQYEIRVFAEAMYELISPHFPMTVRAFNDYILNAKTFSTMELEILGKYLNYEEISQSAKPSSMSAREWTEFLTTIQQLTTIVVK